MRFAELARAAVEAHGGSVIELRGDEALAVFDSPRGAVAAAVAMQRRFADAIRSEPAWPLRVGIGIDAGEAVQVGDGFRGGALNLAARLCSRAQAGEVLVSDGIAHLARGIDGVTFADGGKIPVKGVPEPVHILRARFELDLPAIDRLGGRRRWAALAMVVIIASGAVAGLAVHSGGGSGRIQLFRQPALYAVDPASGALQRGIELGDRPSAVALGEGAIWVADVGLGVVERVDPESGRSVQIPVGSDPADVAVTPSAVWVANSGDGTVTRIAPSGRSVSFRVGNGPAGIVAYDHAIWVTLSLDNAVVRVDPADDHVSKPIPAGADPTAIAAGAAKLWVTNESRGEVTPIDPREQRAEAPIPVGAGPNSIVAGPHDVWVANTLAANITDIDPADGQPRQTVRVDSAPVTLTLVEDGVLATTASGAVWRIDRTGSRQLSSLGVAPQAAVAARGTVWVASAPPPSRHRGGTLVLANGGSEPDWTSIDPGSGHAWWYIGWETLAVTNDGLVAFKRVAGADGGTVVPDLARTIPAPTRDGRTWTFRIRAGVHYSNGAKVRPSDFRRAIERVFRLGTGFTEYYDHIVGADACTTRSCDLRRGIATDDVHGTVEFNLTSPDPEFLYHLALPFADALPPSVPNTDTRATPVPATGPYEVSSFDPKTGAATLIRNRRFREWSKDSQPAGFPDRIEWRPFANGAAALRAIEQGHADWMFDNVPSGSLREAKLGYPTRFHPAIFPYTSYLQLATTRPPFDRSQARLALSRAVDRSGLIALRDANGQKRPTCQISPPNVFGYAPICPGGPPRPDVNRARLEVSASGTRGMRVTLFRADHIDPVAHAVFRTLAKIGYRPAWTSSPDADVTLGAYVADFPSVANFFEFACVDFCSRYRRLEHLIARAQAAELSEQPGQAGPLWAAAERLMLRLGAPWVPLDNAVATGFVSKRVGNYQFGPPPGDQPLIDQMWVR
jgi:peptide/nickel transport system substrate-binding protein